MTTLEFLFDKTPKTLAAGVADQITTNVYDAGSAKRVFAGSSLRPPMVQIGAKITVGTGVLSIRARLVGADNAALTTKPEVLADTGVQTHAADGQTALAIGDAVYYGMHVLGQRTPKQYYGVIFTQGTADEVCEVTAVITEAAQTNMPGRKAAVP